MHPSMNVRKINTNSTLDVARFVQLPFELYRLRPQWVPPLVSQMKWAMNRAQNPFYHESTADFFIAETGEQVLGRIAVINNRRYNEYRHSRTAFFGYFESVDDQRVACALFEAAYAWARSHCLNEVIGPRSLTGVDGGIQVEGFAHRASLSVPYTQPYYPKMLDEAGFVKDTDLLSGYLPGNYKISEREQRIARKVEGRRQYWVKTFASKGEIREWLPRVLRVHAAAFSRLHSYYPPSSAEVHDLTDTILTIADPSLVKLVMLEEEIIGFILAHHDLAAGLQKAKGSLWPLGWWHLLREKKRTRWVNIPVAGLLPDYQGLGGHALLHLELHRTLQAHQFQHLDIGPVDEQNQKSRAVLDHLGVTWYKRHRLYRRVIGY